MSNKQSIGIKETLTSLMIAFMMAFVFRGFVIEGFIIPTGSMAPTLLGKHVRFVSPYNGYDWPTNYWDTTERGGRGQPLSRQGGSGMPPITPSDPMTGLPIEPQRDRRLAAGDRVFVLKYLPGVHRPERWDVVVFKFPGDHQNFIKRLVGLPNEQILMVDGDIFYRPYAPGTTSTAGPHAWREDGWNIARKSERTQRTMFQDVFDSHFTPIRAEPTYRPPISPDGSAGAWSGVQDAPTWTYTGSGPTALAWNDRRPITDYYPYNQASPERNPNSGQPAANPFLRPEDLAARAMPPYPVSDLALTLHIEPTENPVAVTPTIAARDHVFQAVIDPVAGKATLRMRRDEDGAAWTDLDAADTGALRPGRITRIEFWHVDQALWLFIDGRLIAGGPDRGAYALTPAQRIEAAMIPSFDELVAQDEQQANEFSRPGVTSPGVFARPELYRQPRVRWEFSGGPLTVHRVAVQRDIFYQPMPMRASPRATLGAHYKNFPTLSPDQFFMLGDNSPASEDSRLWPAGSIDPWIRERIDATPGVVNRDLIVGKAFIVYFPAPLDTGPVLAPDIGRVRWIW